jgi:hypothetical protein
MPRRKSTGLRLHEAALSLLFSFVTFGALHDITAGLETDVSLEYAALLVCAGWWTFVIARLLRSGRRVAAALSALAVAGAVWALYVGHVADHTWGDAPSRMLAVVSLWFGVLSLLLFVWLDTAPGDKSDVRVGLTRRSRGGYTPTT